MALGLALFLTSGHGSFADPVVGGNPSTVPTTTVSTPDVTPAGDVVARPVPSPSVPPVVVKAKAFTASLKRRAQRREMRYLQKRIGQYQRSAVKWAWIRGAHVPQRNERSLASEGISVLKHQLREAEHLDNQQRVISQNPPHKSDWLCIHGGEGSWQDPNAPYWGGLQMNRAFMQRYGGWLYQTKGTADHWTPLEQMWVAEKALPSRGFWPWPNTAAACGLL